MGVGSSEPVTRKETDRVSSSKFVCGSSCMQGWRINMEDAHVHLPEIPNLPETSYFSLNEGNITKAFKSTFLQFDAEIRGSVPPNVGSTANVVLIVRNMLFCSNIGDSRTVVSIGGIARDLSEDHKPHSDKEIQRISGAGGFVTNFRVNGGLALSRAFGDFMYKDNGNLPPEKQMVIAVPDVTYLKITNDFEFFVMACDGIWDVMTSQEVVNFVRLRIAANMPPHIICEELMTNCLAPDIKMGGLGCDNMTVMICCFIQHQTYKQLMTKCASPVAVHTFPEYPIAPPLPEGPSTQNAVVYRKSN
ncbi:hypothetical protein HELRODRAFT_155765 [Helobdella robusta]|uniref:protein-serine/threonine phosphatase n=1 Tax=Helobdella robusta TaxID=6412 RepID=T1ELM2_HELRO|nr:hypothetical protein HELRODRAFT_155765 [Helobdella robusta]ESO01979.1 hypothetical protein HELRODRAFT_155765 [Helobdella robusta]